MGGIYMKNKSVLRGAVSLLLALTMIVAFTPAIFAADTGKSSTLTELPSETFSLSPIPLLILKVSFDANGNGKNDFDVANGSALYANKDSELYGEQWCYSSDKYWYDTFFSDDKSSMKTYYKEVSNGNFYFYPVEETYASAASDGVVNDGVVEVVIPYKHPMASTGSESNEDAVSRMAALEAATKYIDFAKYDKNGDGYISYTELAIVFVCGGYEYSFTRSRPCDKMAFGVWAHQTSGSGIKTNGVTVGRTFLRVGEYLTDTQPITMGTVAHELGHHIGAPDLYDENKTSSSSNWSYAGDVSLMASGSWNNISGKQRGSSPSYMDPYNAIECGLLPVTEVYEDGEYTMYSRHSSKGEYNILKIRTANPKEYYLVENRYHEECDTQFDAIASTNRAIMIWHIDENIASGSGVNTSGKGHDPGVVPMGVSGLSASNCGFKYLDNSLDGRSYTFESNSSKYRFPISGTSYTSVTAEEASTFAIKITVKEGSYAGDEMVISVSVNAKLAPEFSVSTEEKLTTALSFKGKITNLFGGDVTSVKAIISKKTAATEADGIVKTITPDSNGDFKFTFDGLDTNTKYFCKVIVEGKNGAREKTYTAFTMPEKKEHTDYYEIFLYKGLTAVEKRNRVKVKPGETFKYTFPMEKRGYDFCGWYTDPEFTTRYDMGFTQTVCEDFTLYAKWVETGNTASLKLVGAESKYLLFACEIGDSFDAPVPAEKAGYKFIGWYADESLTVPYDFGQKVEEAGEITIYAKWESTGEEKPETTTETKITETTTKIETTTSTGETTTAASAATTTSDTGKGGCKSVMGVGASFAIIVTLGAALAVKKKKSE